MLLVLYVFLGEDCKKKWKNMRDRYLKEVRMEIKSKKEGENLQSKWKYRQLMNFIAPFTGSRSGGMDICSNNDDHENPDNESGSTEGEYASPEAVKTPQSILKGAASQPDHKPQLAFVTQLPPMPQEAQTDPLSLLTKTPSGQQIPTSSKTGRKRRLMPDDSPSQTASQSTMSPTKWLVKENGASIRNRARDEDELFMLSFVPALKRLAPQRRCETKIKIQQIMYEAEFNISQQPEPQEKQLESDAQD